MVDILNFESFVTRVTDMDATVKNNLIGFYADFEWTIVPKLLSAIKSVVLLFGMKIFGDEIQDSGRFCIMEPFKRG